MEGSTAALIIYLNICFFGYCVDLMLTDEEAKSPRAERHTDVQVSSLFLFRISSSASESQKLLLFFQHKAFIPRELRSY